MNNLRKYCFLMFFIFLSSYVFAEQSQFYSKVFLQPAYKASYFSNTNVTFTVSIIPPDRISTISSSIIGFNLWSSNGGTFKLWVNNRTCNTINYSSPFFAISVPVQFTLYYDCSNVIKSAGTYEIKFQPSVSVLSSTAWLEATYVNNPKGAIQVFGTEYSPTELATIFLQVTDNQGFSNNNASCYLTVYSPLVNGSHLIIIDRAPMLSVGRDGLYFYDLTAPSTLGVYMSSVSCGSDFNPVRIYPEDSIFFANLSSRKGTWTGTPIILNRFDDDSYMQCTSAGGTGCSGNFTWDLTPYSSALENTTNISLYTLYQTDKVENLTFEYWNASRWVLLPNFGNTRATGKTTPTDYDDFRSTSIPIDGKINNSISIRVNTSFAGTGFFFVNWLALSFLTTFGRPFEIRGGGEMHISNVVNLTANLTQFVVLPQLNATLIMIRGHDLGMLQNFSIVFANLTNIQNNLGFVNITTFDTNIVVHQINRTLMSLQTIQDNLYTNLTIINSNLTTIRDNVLNISTLLNASNFNVTQILIGINDIKLTLSGVVKDLNTLIDKTMIEIDWIYRNLKERPETIIDQIRKSVIGQ